MLSTWAFLSPGLATTDKHLWVPVGTAVLAGTPPSDPLWDAVADQGSTTNVVLEGGTAVGAKGRIRVCRTPKHLLEPSRVNTADTESLPPAGSGTKRSKALAEPSPGKGQHPCALLQQWWLSLSLSSGCEPLTVPCKAPAPNPAPVSQMWGSCSRRWGEGVKSREGEWCRRGAGSPSDIKTSACAWVHQVGIYAAK